MADKLQAGSTVGGYQILHKGNIAQYMNQDTLDTSDFMQKTLDNTFTGDLVSSSRNRGLFGVYNSTLTDQIWSMGTSYRNSSDGSNFGNLYGLAYKHTNNPTGGSMAGGHQMVWCSNGTPKSAIGDDLWTSGKLNAPIAQANSFRAPSVTSTTDQFLPDRSVQVITFSTNATLSIVGTLVPGQFGVIQFENFTEMDSWDSKISWSQDPDNGLFGSDGDSMSAVFMVISTTKVKFMKFID